MARPTRKRKASALNPDSDNYSTGDFITLASPTKPSAAPSKASAKKPRASPSSLSTAAMPPPTTPATPAANATSPSKRASRARSAVSPSPTPSTFSQATKPRRIVRKKEPLSLRPTSELGIYVFGDNLFGQLGLPSPTHATMYVPGVETVETPQLSLRLQKYGVVQVAAGSAHAVALTGDGKVVSWGCVDLGALGRDVVGPGARGEFTGAIWEVDRAWGDEEITQVAASEAAGFALTNKGDVWGWGSFRDSSGAIGLTPSDPNPAFTPIPLPTLTSIQKIASAPSANHLLALSTTGTVYALGIGEQNQLGRRLLDRNKRHALTATKVAFTQSGHHPTPASSPASSRRHALIVDIAASDAASYAIDADARVWSWGRNDFFQLGHSRGLDAVKKEDDAPTATPNADDAVAPKLCAALAGAGRIVRVAGGRDFALAVSETGELLAWGRVDGGLLGLGSNATVLERTAEHVRRVGVGMNAAEMGSCVLTRATAVDVGPVAEVQCSSFGAAVVDEKGSVWAWGDGRGFGLGTGSERDLSTPFCVARATGTRKVPGRRYVKAVLGRGWGVIGGREDENSWHLDR